MVDEEDWPDDGFEDAKHARPEARSRLYVVDRRSDRSQAVDSPSAFAADTCLAVLVFLLCHVWAHPDSNRGLTPLLDIYP